MSELLEIIGLDVSFPSQQGTTYAVRNVSITLKPGEVLGVVGESGAGKSTVGNAVINLLEPPGIITNGKVLFQGENISGLNDTEMRHVRGQKIGVIFRSFFHRFLIDFGRVLEAKMASKSNKNRLKNQ